MRGIVRDSLSEMLDRKIFWVFGVVTVLSILLAALSRNIDVNIQTSDPAFDMAKQQVHIIAIRSLSAYLAFLVFLAVMASASIMPTMLERGRADFYLSKPISRPSLLISKLLSTWLVYGGMVIISCLLVYGTVGLVHGTFDSKVLLMLAIASLQLLVWLSITFAAGVFSGSTSMAIITAFLLWILQAVLIGREAIKMFLESKFASVAIDGLYYVTPKSSQIADIGLALAINDNVYSWLPLWTSLSFAAVLLLVTLAFFRNRDY